MKIEKKNRKQLEHLSTWKDQGLILGGAELCFLSDPAVSPFFVSEKWANLRYDHRAEQVAKPMHFDLTWAGRQTGRGSVVARKPLPYKVKGGLKVPGFNLEKLVAMWRYFTSDCFCWFFVYVQALQMKKSVCWHAPFFFLIFYRYSLNRDVGQFATKWLAFLVMLWHIILCLRRIVQLLKASP